MIEVADPETDRCVCGSNRLVELALHPEVPVNVGSQSLTDCSLVACAIRISPPAWMMAGLCSIARATASSSVTVGICDTAGSATEPKEMATAKAIASMILLFIIMLYVGVLPPSSVGPFRPSAVVTGYHLPIHLNLAAVESGDDLGPGVNSNFVDPSPLLFPQLLR